MGDAGFFRGTSSDQDGRFSDKEKKLLKQMKFEDTLDRKINMDKINLDVIKPWITLRINEILGIEDDVVIEYIMSQLEEKTINPKIMQINITGFLNARRAREFMGELWMLLVEADESEDGIPQSLIEKKINEMRKEPRATGNGEAKLEPTPQSCDWANRYSSLSGGRYTGPTKEKGVSDDRITRISPQGGTPPRNRKNSASHDDTPPRRSLNLSVLLLSNACNNLWYHDCSALYRERRRAEEREREKRRRRSRTRSRSPARRRFTEGSSSSKRRRSPSFSDSEEESKKKKRKKHSRRYSDDESDYEKKPRKEKKSKKHKKERKKKDRKRSPTPSSDSLSDTE
ncbi:PWI domain protein [Dictyocaulus viviparus]|uniref:PWI domain protein n=1 Tax=Dictyocaulus viviparus TaxID=29172 RepID=A0A0D8XQV1_DICVI|nr:PWI domain protein [Dictyocaulus viviparus]